ncbi:SIS domain-containing protein [Collinsella sp. zg1085]|nr:SIS domain-containing protein [Collinsella sp. zg1085]
MLFDEAKKRAGYKGVLALRPQIEACVDRLVERGYSNICWLGIGGTWASALQVVVHMKEHSALETWAENAAEFVATGNRRLNAQTVVVISSVTGSTPEVIEAIHKVKSCGAYILGFIDKADSELARLVDTCITFDGGEQLKFFMVADRFMAHAGEIDHYAALYAELDEHLADALIKVEYAADAFAAKFATAHADDDLHYFIGAGNQWGATYSYAMCYWEEQFWIKTKSITAAEFFHGTLEIITRDTPVTLYIGEDSQRALAERVAAFVPRICANLTVIDTRDYELAGISDEFRGDISHLVMHAINDRIDAHLEIATRHPMDIRRYYRCLPY